MSLIAQATTTDLTTPSVDWWGVMPLLLLTAPAMVLLHASSLLPKVFKGFYTSSPWPSRWWPAGSPSACGGG
ncbi:MAG: hypothetical protein R2749_02415 [Acidimicrobiales bacterium]